MTKHTDIKALESNIADAEYVIAQREKALKLSANSEFRDLFINGFFRDEAARLVQISTDPNLSLQDREDALAMAQSTGHAKRYLSVIVQQGYVAERDLPAMRATLEEVRALPDEDDGEQ